MKSTLNLTLFFAATLASPTHHHPAAKYSNHFREKRDFLSCEKTYGKGSINCGDENAHFCYNPALGEVCCPLDNGYCNAGDFCAPFAGHCCHNLIEFQGENHAACAVRLSVSTSTPPSTTSIFATSTTAVGLSVSTFLSLNISAAEINVLSSPTPSLSSSTTESSTFPSLLSSSFELSTTITPSFSEFTAAFSDLDITETNAFSSAKPSSFDSSITSTITPSPELTAGFSDPSSISAFTVYETVTVTVTITEGSLSPANNPIIAFATATPALPLCEDAGPPAAPTESPRNTINSFSIFIDSLKYSLTRSAWQPETTALARASDSSNTISAVMQEASGGVQQNEASNSNENNPTNVYVPPSAEETQAGFGNAPVTASEVGNTDGNGAWHGGGSGDVKGNGNTVGNDVVPSAPYSGAMNLKRDEMMACVATVLVVMGIMAIL
ncbi:hypothetical protein B0O99DRAFT_602788 [Bisporella sp. PMI_857]|nr:hypothetical protein B0O99DRAFT_602788 [Bisporella sp. PMI_857]